MNGQTVALAAFMLLAVPTLAYGILRSTNSERVGRYTPRHLADRQKAFVRASEEVTKSMQRMVPAFQQMGAAAKKAAQAMKRLGEQIKRGENYRDYM